MSGCRSQVDFTRDADAQVVSSAAEPARELLAPAGMPVRGLASVVHPLALAMFDPGETSAVVAQ